MSNNCPAKQEQCDEQKKEVNQVKVSKPAVLVETSFALGLLKAQSWLLFVVGLIVLVTRVLGSYSAQTLNLACGVLIVWCGNVFATWRSYYSFKQLLLKWYGVSAYAVLVSPRVRFARMMQAVIGRMFVVSFGVVMVIRFVEPLLFGWCLLGMVLMLATAWIYPLWIKRD